jgi:hypothetical protein
MFGPSNEKDVEAFFAEIAPWSATYTRASVTCLALKTEGEWRMYCGRVALGVMPTPGKTFATDSVFATQYDADVDPSMFRELFDKFFAEGVTYDDRKITFAPPTTGGSRFSTYFAPYTNGSVTQMRTTLLRIFGEKFQHLENKEPLNWHVMSAREPYGSFAELLTDYGLNDPNNQGGHLEIIGNVPCIIDLETSTLTGGTAAVVVKALPAADTSKMTLGTQIMGQGKTTRLTLSGDKLQWETGEKHQTGRCAIDVPPASALRLFLSYGGQIQNHVWLIDYAASPNARRIVHQTFDPQFGLLTDMLQKPPQSRQDSKEFEAAISWLFWMLGFSPLTWSASKRLTDAPDTALQAENGTILLVEATTKTLRAENKLPNLVERAQQLRAAFAKLDVHLTVVPIICSALTDEALGADMDMAQSLGIAVVSAGVLEEFVRRTMQVPNSNAIVSEIQLALSNWQNRQRPA